MGIMSYRKAVLGQNFLINKKIARNIIDICNFSAEDDVLEIGPGEGILTELIIGNTKTFTMIEIDPFYFNFIKGKFHISDSINNTKHNGINIVNEDALKYDYRGLSFKLSPKIRVVSNLPYEISSPIMDRFIREKEVIADLTLMFQKEFAGRLCAKENDSQRGALSVIMDINFEITKLLDVDKSNFNPAPKVDSTVLRLNPRYHADKDFIWAANTPFFSHFVHQTFKCRRKKLKNSIYASFFEMPPDIKNKIFTELNIDLNKRPQELTTVEFINAAKGYDDYLKNRG
ncbi:MAG TPA: ribosomal RNA small subunit methyltransferase A [bacterium]|mgnify:CR=1 FL=1|nr:ribosomal RNA small subunit methyltransferase A [bacterium]